jgi:polyphosphate kinase
MAGVPIDLIIRGLCCIRAGVPGLSETIKVRSVVGQFLEHSRIFQFGGGDGHSSEDDWNMTESDQRPPLRILIGSSDLMRRNLDRRIEVLAPVRDRKLIERLLEVLDLVLDDDTNSWELGLDGTWHRVPTTRSLSLQERLKELALGRARRRRDLDTRAQPSAPAAPGA